MNDKKIKNQAISTRLKEKKTKIVSIFVDADLIKFMDELSIFKFVSQMKKTGEQTFLSVKEGLDYYRLPTIFPVQATDLLAQLLGLLRRQGSGKENTNSPNLPSEVDGALRHEIGKVTKENNRLHVELMNAREQISALQYSIQKHALQRKGGKEEMGALIAAKRRREDQLFEELTQVKFKYNELMDLVNEDPNIEKQYLKRLLKHRKMEITDKTVDEGGLNSQKNGPSRIAADLQAKVALLTNKVANRQAEITRMQKKMEYDGLNINKILKDFQKSRVDNKITVLEDQVKYLEDENQKMKKEVNHCRKTGGRHEALREEIRKNHETITKINADNKGLKRKIKQKQADHQFKGHDDNRKVNKAEDKTKQILEGFDQQSTELSNLKKRNEYLEKELAVSKDKQQQLKEKLLNQQIENSQLKNRQEGGNILSQYEAETAKQKLFQAESILKMQEDEVVKLKGENQYYREEGLLKSQAIENLEKIVDELMRKNNYPKGYTDPNSEVHATNLENTISLRKNLSETKQALSLAQGEKTRIQKELSVCTSRLEQKIMENAQLGEEVHRLKTKMLEMKGDFEDVLNLQRNLEKSELDCRREQNARMKAEALLEQADSEKARLRRELQELSQQFQIYEKKAKNHINGQKLEVVELDEVNHLLDIRIKQKDKKVASYEQRIQELQSKVKLLRDEVTLLQDQKHAIILDKHRVEKRHEELLRWQEEALKLQESPDSHLEPNSQPWRKEKARLQEKVELQSQHIVELTKLCETRTGDKEALVREKIALVRENDQLKLDINRLERALISEGRA